MQTIRQRTLRDTVLQEVSDIRPGVWIHMEEPSRDDLESFASEHNLEQGLLTDAIDPYEVPRLEIENGIPYFFCRVPSKERRDMSTIPLMIAIHPKFVVSIAPDTHGFISSIIRNTAIPPTTQKVKFFIAMLSAITQQYNRSIMSARREVNRIKVAPNEVTDAEILRFVQLESDLNEYLSSLQPMHTMYEELFKGSVLKLYEEDKDLIDDLILSSEQQISGITSTLKTIVNIRQAYSVVATNRLNNVITTLTIVTVLLTVPTIVTSFFGMNVPLPLERAPYATFIIVTLSAIIMSAVFWFMKRNKWL